MFFAFYPCFDAAGQFVRSSGQLHRAVPRDPSPDVEPGYWSESAGGLTYDSCNWLMGEDPEKTHSDNCKLHTERLSLSKNQGPSCCDARMLATEPLFHVIIIVMEY